MGATPTGSILTNLVDGTRQALSSDVKRRKAADLPDRIRGSVLRRARPGQVVTGRSAKDSYGRSQGGGSHARHPECNR